MNENTKKLLALLESNQALAEKIHQQETIDAAYAMAEETVPGLTPDEFMEWARVAHTDKEGALTDEQLEGATGGIIRFSLSETPTETQDKYQKKPSEWKPFI